MYSRYLFIYMTKEKPLVFAVRWGSIPPGGKNLKTFLYLEYSVTTTLSRKIKMIHHRKSIKTLYRIKDAIPP